MFQVRVIGWKEEQDVLPISFAKIVQEHCSVGLRASKAALDDFAEYGEVVVGFEREGEAAAFAAAAAHIGARCEVREHTSAARGSSSD